MTAALDSLTAHLLGRVRQVQQSLGADAAGPDDSRSRFADLLDSMGMVEFLALLAADCGVTPAAIEACAGHNFNTVADLAGELEATGLVPHNRAQSAAEATPAAPRRPASVPRAWLASTAVRLPATVQPAAALNEALQRPPGWLEARAGIRERRTWADQDPLSAAAAAARDCLSQAGLLVEEVGLLLVTAEAPPLLVGLAADMHHRLDLRPSVPALEVGGACTGFLAALWLAEALMNRAGAVLVVSVEAPTRLLTLQPGPAGEAAALFGDAVAASVLCAQPPSHTSIPLEEVILTADGRDAGLLRVEWSAGGSVGVRMDGQRLAGRAVRALAESVGALAQAHGLAVADLACVVAHGGNGRLPALLARQLGLPPDKVWSETPQLGNLGSASLPVAWAAHQPPPGPLVWTAVGAGLTLAAAFFGQAG